MTRPLPIITMSILLVAACITSRETGESDANDETADSDGDSRVPDESAGSAATDKSASSEGSDEGKMSNSADTSETSDQSDESEVSDTGADAGSDSEGSDAGDESSDSDTFTPDVDDYRGCIKPNHVSEQELNATVLDFYHYWQQEYVRPAGSTDNGYYIASSGETGSSDGTITVSEAQGFGMIITALMAENANSENDRAREIFDGLYRFFKDHPSDVSDDLMAWEVLGDGQGGEQDKKSSTATDGDIDIAYGLLLAHSHWGSSGNIDYLSAALRVLDALPGNNIGRDTKRTTLGSWNDENQYHTRASDWMTGEFNAFAEATGDAYWNDVVDTTYSIAQTMVETYSPGTGLVPDFVVHEDPQPAEPNFLEFEYDGEYYNNSCRVPLRIMTDVRHYETKYAIEWMMRVAHWIDEKTEGDPSKIVGGYYIADGSEIRDKQFPAFTAPLIAAATISADYQDFVNDGWDIISQWRTNYYNDSVNLLAMIQISGKWWKPEF